MSLLSDEAVNSHPSTQVNGHSAAPALHPAPGNPIPSFQLRRSISGIETELLIQTFDDRIMVIITQNGKIGCLTQASLPAVIPLPQPPQPTQNGPTSNHSSGTTTSLAHFPPPPASIALTPLLGSPLDRALHDTYTVHIATLVWWALQEVGAPRRAVVLGLGLARSHAGGGGDAEGEGEGEGERERFAGVLGMVVEWPGPTGGNGST